MNDSRTKGGGTNAALRAPAQAVPEGWKLVPIIPTRKMVDRGYATRPIEECWRVMLEASPLPSTDRAAPPSVEPVAMRNTNAAETWAYIERLLHDECGLRLDEGLGGQRANCINAIRNGNTDPALLAAAVEFLNSGEGLHKIRVNGKMMSRKAVAAALTRPHPGGAVAGTHYQPEEITKAQMDAIEAAAIAGTPLSAVPRPHHSPPSLNEASALRSANPPPAQEKD
jgi:hypothetical protein